LKLITVAGLSVIRHITHGQIIQSGIRTYKA
jgi:hypothetical protein